MEKGSIEIQKEMQRLESEAMDLGQTGLREMWSVFWKMKKGNQHGKKINKKYLMLNNK